MPDFLETALQILAGASLTPSAVFLWFWLRHRKEPEYFWSSLLGISATAYITCSVFEYKASDLAAYLAVLRWQPLFSSLVPVCLLELVAGTRSGSPKWLKPSLHSWAVLVAFIGVVRVAIPDLTFQATSIHSTEMVGGFGRLQLLEVRTNPWSIPIWCALFASILFGFIATFLGEANEKTPARTRLLRVALALLLLAAIHDVLAISFRFPWPYFAEPTLSLVILLQAQRLVWDLLQSHSLRRGQATQLEMFELLFQQNPLACIVSRLDDGRILLANPRFVQLYGADSMATVQGRTSLEIGLWSDVEAREKELADCIDGDRAKFRTVWYRTGGVSMNVSVSVQRIRYQGADCLLTMAEDIDAEIRAQEALMESESRTRNLNAELEALVEMKTRDMRSALDELESFTYTVSHDLRSPLRAIDGFAQALIEDHGSALGTAGERKAVRIRNAARRMSALIDDLLSLYSASRVFLARTEVDLSGLSRDLLQKLSAAHPERSVEWIVQDGVHVLADAVLVGIALRHLLDNAWKFSARRATAVIEVSSRERNGRLWIAVRDNGEGFDMAHAANLFGTFQRLHEEPEFEGNGIGLALVKRIVQRHGGEIEVEAKPGAGAEFRFTFDAQERK